MPSTPVDPVEQRFLELMKEACKPAHTDTMLLEALELALDKLGLATVASAWCKAKFDVPRLVDLPAPNIAPAIRFVSAVVGLERRRSKAKRSRFARP
jgi:hypothetical protein